MNNMHVVVPNNTDDDVYYCLGVLNSRLMNWFYQSLNPEMGEALAEVKKTNVERLPIPKQSPDTAEIGKIAHTVEKTLKELRAARSEIQRSNAKRRLDAAFEQLNEKIYALFELTGPEVKLIESSQSKIKIA